MTNNTDLDSAPPDPHKIDEPGGPARPRRFFRYRRGDAWLYLTATVSLMLASFFLVFAIWPRYKDPLTRLYSTRLGYPVVARKFNQPFPVKTSTVDRRQLASSCQGEGSVSSEPNLVPMVPVGRIVRVHARIGDTVKKGQLLAEIDDRFQIVKVSEAKAALDSALNEQQRVVFGTTYTLQNERPDVERIRLRGSRASLKIYDELLAIDRKLNDLSYVSKRDTLLDQLLALKLESDLREQEYMLKIGEKGIKESLLIAENVVQLTRLELKFRHMELDEFKIYAPCDGVIERCFIHEREYNQGPGTPAFLIDESAWFEARMDQATLGQFAAGDRTQVYLQAFPGQPLLGKIDRIIAIVSYDLGGPKATRPVRPLGTGAPEWPSTYAVRIKLDSGKLPVVPGLTGFARICPEKEAVAIPVEALFARSGRTGCVYVVDDDSYLLKKVVFGATSDGWVEISSGLEPGMRVLSEGFQLLKPDDQVEVTHQDGNPIAPGLMLNYAKPNSAR